MSHQDILLGYFLPIYKFPKHNDSKAFRRRSLYDVKNTQKLALANNDSTMFTVAKKANPKKLRGHYSPSTSGYIQKCNSQVIGHFFATRLLKTCLVVIDSITVIHRVIDFFYINMKR